MIGTIAYVRWHQGVIVSILVQKYATFTGIYNCCINLQGRVYSNPKPKHSIWIAPSKHNRSSSSVSYNGKSNLLKHVCARGNLLVDKATLSIVNGRSVPSFPCSPWNPCTGTRLVPVINCNNLALCSWLYSAAAFQKPLYHLVIFFLPLILTFIHTISFPIIKINVWQTTHQQL